MKRIVIVLVFVTLTLSGCSSDSRSNETAAPPKTDLTLEEKV